MVAPEDERKPAAAPRGGLRREALERLVAEGLSIREIASRVDRCPTTVRHWLHRHGLRTARAQRLAHGRSVRKHTNERICPTHGRTAFVEDAQGYERCVRCRSAHVVNYRRRVKERLVRDAGGRCVICGYDRFVGALQFHHVDPTTKAFSISADGVTRSIARLRAEVAKCVLLCSNCHAEVEAGIRSLP